MPRVCTSGNAEHREAAVALMNMFFSAKFIELFNEPLESGFGKPFIFCDLVLKEYRKTSADDLENIPDILVTTMDIIYYA
jgi:hypothetical protein